MDKKLHRIANQFCAEYLGSSAANARHLQEAFEGELKSVHPNYKALVYPFPIFRSSFISEVASTASQLLALVLTLPERLFDGRPEAMLAAQGVREEDAAYLARFLTPSQLAKAGLFARPDFILTNRDFSLVEFNIAPPIGGLGICDRYAAVALRSKLARMLEEHGITCTASPMGSVWGQTMRAHCRRSSADAPPVLFEAISDPTLDLAADFARPDFTSMAQSAGFEVVSGYFDDLELSESCAPHATYHGKRIDVVYTDFVYAEQRIAAGQNARMEKLGRLDELGLLELFSSPACTLFDNKSNFAFLTSHKYANRFSSEERALIARYVPATQMLTSDTVSFALAERERLVLKPALDFGGHGIVLGAQASQDEWRAALHSALQSTCGFIVQELISDTWTFTSAGDQSGEPRTACLGAVHAGGVYAGTLLRDDRYSGAPSIVNVAQGARWGTALSADDV